MRWATRSGVHIDRAACAWLIRRFLDPGAVFVVVDDPGDVPADATAFDMRGVGLSHHAGTAPLRRSAVAGHCPFCGPCGSVPCLDSASPPSGYRSADVHRTRRGDGMSKMRSQNVGETG